MCSSLPSARNNSGSTSTQRCSAQGPSPPWRFFRDGTPLVVMLPSALAVTVAEPRSDEEIVTAATTEGRLREILARVDQNLVVCGHTHAQFDRRLGPKRVVNAGSVGMPYQGKPVGAFWLLLGADGVSLRRSDYDPDRAVERIRATGYPEAEEVAQILLEPPDPEWVAHFFEQQAAGD